MTESIDTIYYRGSLKACNYGCGYCPFRKRQATQMQIEEDQNGLMRLIGYLQGEQEFGIRNVMILPYGEALIYPHWQSGLGVLSSISGIERVGCQTNASFDVDRFFTAYSAAGGLPDKLRLWCTYHPGEVQEDVFADRCCQLSKRQIRYSVGAVGDVRRIPELTRMKKRLPEGVYFWVNALEGRRREYTEAEIEAFSAIDPYFHLQLRMPKADPTLCLGGKRRIFVDDQGIVYCCNISKVRIGNLYSGEWQERRCRAKACSCYLAYSHRTDIEEVTRWGDEGIFRQKRVFAEE